MCGIVGYVGKRQALPILLKGLERLEYRGYDSSGIGVVGKQKIYLRKCQGKIRNLKELLSSNPLPNSTIGISHTRWATHGAPNSINAHPHAGCSKTFSLVHNGIIENHQELKARLLREGHKFDSQTDTEVIVHLIEKYYKGDLLKAVQKAIALLQGSFALAVIVAGQPDKIVVARRGSPLVLGLGKEENFIASDLTPILTHTKKALFLEDNQTALVTKDRVLVFDSIHKKISPKSCVIKWDAESAQKDGFPHFMLKEIYEQPKVLRQILATYIKKNAINFSPSRIRPIFLKKISNIVIVACGTAYHAGMVAKYAIEELARIPVSVDVSSEFRYRKPIINRNSLVIAISQSGETADTLAAINEARKQKAKILAVCNVVGSTLTREADYVLYTLAGPEIGVASTKAYTAQLAVLYLFAIYLAHIMKKQPAAAIRRLINELKTIARKQEKFLKKERQVVRVAKSHHQLGSFLYLGRRINYPSALEGALKLKEISYIPSEGYAAGEMKHGPIALIDEYRAVICIAPDSDIYEKMVSNIQEIRARAGKVVAIVSESNAHIKDYIREVIYIPESLELFSPLLVALPLQLLAYHIAVKRGCDVDQPRNLAKSVTVE
ncbi:MAG TPA: glutamine--fructose-6-phosphate transaminase (isomerizing) [Candidatus Omnitrophica bacterium]|nr:glutamine--fructose-6-phosphate transaminase (isomerizing) [Candidatus Omnitrophota bacterium]